MHPLRLLAPLLAAILVSSLSPVTAQVVFEAGTVTVSGSTVVTAPPDRAVVRLGVQTRADTPAAALREHEADMARVLGVVRSFGIADRAISIEGLSLGENYGPNGPDGYMAARVVSVTVDSLRIVPDLVAGVVESGANRLEGLVYTLSQTARYEDQALGLAMDRARVKAEQIARASGRSLGPVDAVLEQGAGLVEPYMRMGYADVQEAAAVSATPAAYSTGSSQVRAAVTVRFVLLPE